MLGDIDAQNWIVSGVHHTAHREAVSDHMAAEKRVLQRATDLPGGQFGEPQRDDFTELRLCLVVAGETGQLPGGDDPFVGIGGVAAAVELGCSFRPDVLVVDCWPSYLSHCKT